MALIRTHSDPLASLLRLQGSFLRSFDQPARADTALRTKAHENGYEVRLEIPGTAPDDIVVETRDGLLELSIAGRSRSIRLPVDVDLSATEAEYLHGVLTVSVPKKACAQPRQIEIRTA
jgi:HSP20 family molecular chaperone IbpA